MTRRAPTLVTLATVLVLAVVPLARAAEEEGVVSAERFGLDEYNADIWRAGDAAKVGVGLTFGTVLPSRWFWSYGGRVSWVQYGGDEFPRDRGIALGGVIGGGYDPERTVSPVALVSLDVPFSVDRVAFEASAMLGARIRLTTSETEQLAVTFGLYRTTLFGDSGSGDRGETGLAVLFSSALLSRR